MVARGEDEGMLEGGNGLKGQSHIIPPSNARSIDWLVA